MASFGGVHIRHTAGAGEGNGCRVIFADFSSRMPGKFIRKNSGTIGRLDDTADWNRIELEQVLTHGGHVMPVRLVIRIYRMADVEANLDWAYTYSDG